LKLLLVDDHVMFRQGLEMLLADFEPHVDLVHAGSVAEATKALGGHTDIALILLDLGLPDGGGAAPLDLFRREYEHIPVVMLSSTDDPEIIMETIDHGAMGYVPKSLSAEVMRSALRMVLSGSVYLPPNVLTRSSRRHAAALLPRHSGEAAARGVVTPADLGLTPRQADVLRQILQGKSVKMIARALGMTENTAKTHVGSVLRALHVANRTQAVVVANEIGLVVSEPDVAD
jgi:DNA-binding NarL/FixJ family response regulator